MYCDCCKSIINATLTCSCVGIPPCSWESLLGEGSFSLNDWTPLLSHWNIYQSCNSPCVDLLFSLLGFSLGVVCLMICCNVNVTCANLILKICRMDVNVIYYDPWIGKLKNFYVWMFCNEVGVVCHGGIDGCNLYMWSLSMVRYSWGGCNYPYVVTWSRLCMNHDDLSCDVCKTEIVIWNYFACPCPTGGASNLIWHGSFCEVWVGDVFQGFPKEVSCVDNPWQCDHNNHTQSM